MDTPVTLQQLEHGNWPSYLPVEGLGSFDLVLSYTGGRAIEILKSLLKARRVEPLYGWVDPDTYQKTNSRAEYQCDLSYLGTYSADRQLALDTLLIEPARQLPEKRFIIAGAMYPDRAAWPSNVRSFDHVAPPDHASFYSSGTLTLNVTRGAMASMGYCPSGRLFEAAACRAPVMSDWWLGLDSFFTPGKEILIAENSDQAGSILRLDPRELSGIAARARERTLDCHTAEKRARRLLQLIESMPVGSDALRVCGGVS
ncbi:MAG TPA: glycosyltransferase [Bryobacteraceae bacterium]|jgi:spore maturation protein CgeB|nr:glycosyltransferase [Bryobacteraceae bacterium]